MARVNRFSRPAQVAKFDPMSAEEVMAVPLLKQEMEDSQIAENRTLLKDLYNKKALSADQEIINKRKDELESKLSSLAEDISKNGISRQKTNAFNKLKQEYDKELSASGKIGHADAIYAQKEDAKKNFYTAAMKANWNKDDADLYWNQALQNASAFGEDGTFSTEFPEVGLPNYTTVEDELGAIVNQIGIQKGRDPQTGLDITTNREQLVAAGQGILSKFLNPNTPEGKLALAKGWDKEYLEGAVSNKLNSMLKYTEDHSRNDNLEAIGMKAKAKAQDSLAADLAMRGESTFKVNPGLLRAADVKETKTERAKELTNLAEEIQEHIDNGDYAEAEKAEQQYQNLNKIYAGLNDWYKNSEIGRNLQKNIDGVIENSNAKEYLRMLNEGKDADRYADGPTPTDEELAKYREAVAQYEQGMNTLIDDNKAHVLSKEIVFTGTNFIKQGQTEDKWKAYEQEVKNEFSRNTGAFKIIDANFLTEGDVEPLEELYGKNSEVVAKHINNALAVNSKDIELISYIPGSGLQPPGYRIRVQIPADPANMRTNKDKFGKELTGKTIEVTVGISPAAGSSAKSLVTTKFANINDEGAAIAKAANDYYKYEGFIPSYTGGEVDDKRNPYYNDNEIKGYFKSDGLGKKLYGNKDVKLDVYKDTNTGTFKLRTRDESGFVTNLSNREAFSTIDVTDDRKMAESIQNGAAPAIELLDKIIKQDPQFLNARTRAEQAARAKEILDFLKTSDAPVEASSYQDILNILE